MTRLTFPAVLILLLAILLPASLQAATGGEVQIATNGRDDAERNRAYRAGLRWLVRNRLDNLNGADRQQVNAVFDNAQDFVDAFEFVEVSGPQNLDSIPVTSTVRDSNEATHILTVQFSLPAITSVLSTDDAALDGEASSSSAPAIRVREPSNALLWLLVRDGANDLIVSEDTAPGVVARLREIAGGLGWSVGFPALDIDDLAFVGPDEISAASTADSQETTQSGSGESLPGLTLPPRLNKASERYKYDMVLTASADKSADGRWTINIRRDFVQPDETLDQSPRSPLKAEGVSLDKLLQRAMAWNAGLSVERSEDNDAIDLTSGLSDSNATIWIADVAGTPEYMRLMRTVKAVAGVDEVTALEIRRDGVLLSLVPRASLARVSAALQGRTWLRLLPTESLTAPTGLSTDLPADTSGNTIPEPTAKPTAPPKSDLAFEIVR